MESTVARTALCVKIDKESVRDKHQIIRFNLGFDEGFLYLFDTPLLILRVWTCYLDSPGFCSPELGLSV